MGQVMGEDAVEVAPAATDCVQDCQAQNRMRGRFVVLGFPFPVPAASRLDAGAPAAVAPARAPAPARARALAPRQAALRLGARARVVRVAVLRGGRTLKVSYRRVARGTHVFRARPDRRGLRPGRYQLELRAGRDRRHLGRAVRLAFTV